MTPAVRQRSLLHRLGLGTGPRFWRGLPLSTRRRAGAFAPVAVAAALAVHALLATPIVADLAEIRTSRGSDYADARTRFAFAGLPIDRLRAPLDATLPLDAGIALEDPVLADPFLHQRLAEGLYPRRVDQRSPYSLGLRAEGSGPDPDAQALAPYGAATLVFRGPPLVRLLPAPPLATSGGNWPPFLAAVCSVAGLGLLVVRLARIAPPDPLLAPSVVLLAGSLGVGLLTSVATWLQLPLVGLPLGVAGVVAGLTAALVAPQPGRTWAFCAAFCARTVAAARKPENWILAAVLAAVLARMASVPVSLWDGRSIWLLRAHQLRHNGRLAISDALPPEYQSWTHPGYPLLFPGWLAHFTAFSSGWDERAAALGIAILLAAVLPLDWALARERLGRWLGAALVFSVFSSVAYLTTGAYADGWLTLLLLLELLALADAATERLGWLGAMVVSLLKWEGLVFGATVAAACTLGFRHLRARRAVRRWAPLSVFVPALLHLGWDLLHGVAPSNYQDTPWHLVVAQWPARLHAVVDETWHLLQVEGYTRCHAVVWAGVAGALVAGGWAVTRGLPDRVGRLALGLAALFTVFTFGVLTLSPFDPAWHAGTAADRLLLPAGAFALMAALAVVARCGAANASDGREDRARDATSPRPAGGVVPSRSPSPPSS